MAKAPSDIGPTEAAAVSEVVSTIVTAATASVSAAVRGMAPTSSAPTSVEALATSQESLPRSTAPGHGIDPTCGDGEGSAVDNSAAAAWENPLDNAESEDVAAGADRSRRLKPLVPTESKNFLEDVEGKGERPRGTARVVYSRGPENGGAVWVAGRREAAAVKVRLF